MSRRFTKAVKCTLAICSNDFVDKFGHAHESLRELFEEFGVEVLSTKTGDAQVESVNPHGTQFSAWSVVGMQTH